MSRYATKGLRARLITERSLASYSVSRRRSVSRRGLCGVSANCPASLASSGTSFAAVHHSLGWHPNTARTVTRTSDIGGSADNGSDPRLLQVERPLGQRRKCGSLHAFERAWTCMPAPYRKWHGLGAGSLTFDQYRTLNGARDLRIQGHRNILSLRTFRIRSPPAASLISCKGMPAALASYLRCTAKRTGTANLSPSG